MGDREQLLQRARLAEQAERYDDMASAMKAMFLWHQEGITGGGLTHQPGELSFKDRVIAASRNINTHSTRSLKA